MTIAFASRDGLGNLIECLPAAYTMQETFGEEVHLIAVQSSYAIDDGVFPLKVVLPEAFDYRRYSLLTGCPIALGKLFPNKYPADADVVPTSPNLGFKKFLRSEVDLRMDVLRKFGIPTKQFIWHPPHDNISDGEAFDVVMANGYNYKGHGYWKVKTWPEERYVALCERLKAEGLSVASIGAGQEYVAGSHNRTDMLLSESFGLVKSARVVVCNDTAMFHAANWLRTPNVVIFTFTDRVKNIDDRFHDLAVVAERDDLDCTETCYVTGQNLKCSIGHECQNVPVDFVFQEVMEIIDGESRKIR